MQKDKRVIVLNAILSNKDMFKIVEDALKSPVGSTKRLKAKSIFGSLGKYNNIPDGQGGGFDVPVGNNLDWAKVSVAGQPQNNLNPLPLSTQMANTTPAMMTTPETTTIPATEKKKGTIFFSAAPGIRTSITTPYMVENTPKLPATPATSSEPGTEDWLTDLEKEASTTSPVSGTNETMETTANIPTTGTSSVSSLNGIDDWWNSLSDEEKKSKQFLYDELKKGVGADTFSLMALSDKEKMKALFPGVPEDQLPVGATYLDQFKDIEENLRNDYKLDTMEGNLSRLKKNGVNIESDLDNYMTARVSYIQKLDNMINSAKDKSVNVDVSNPNDQQALTNYVNYLYVMKGRQQKRYADFVKQAVDQYTAELKASQDAYDINYKAFTTALANKKDIYKEDYKNFQSMLKDMYENVENREKNLYNQLLLDDKYNKLLAGQVGTALAGAGYSTLTQSQKNTALSKFLNASGKTNEEAMKEWNAMNDTEKLKWLSYSSSSADDFLNDLAAIVAANKTE